MLQNLFFCFQSRKQPNNQNNEQNADFRINIQKSLTKNLRLMVYSYLSIYQSYRILILLNKSEKSAIPCAKKYRIPQNDEFYINSQYLSDKLNLRQLRMYTSKYTLIFKELINKTQVNKYVRFIQAIHKYSKQDEEIELNIELNQCQNLEILKGLQSLHCNTIKFGNLSIVKADLTFEDQTVFQFISIFSKIQLQNSFIGTLLMKQVENCLNSEIQLNTQTPKPFLKLREINMRDCFYIDPQMLSSLNNQQIIVMNNTLLCNHPKYILDNRQYMQNLKFISSLHIFDKEDFQVKYSNENQGIDYSIKFLQKCFENLQKLYAHKLSYSIKNLITDSKILKQPETNIRIKFDSPLILASNKVKIYSIDEISITLYVQNSYNSYDQQEDDISFKDELNIAFKQLNISLESKHQEGESILLQFIKLLDDQIKNINYKITQKVGQGNKSLQISCSLE